MLVRFLLSSNLREFSYLILSTYKSILYNIVYCPFCQNMEKTDVNQIYGDYYFSNEGEVIVDSNNFDVKPH